MNQHDPKPENPFVSLIVNIFLPVFILNKGGHYLDPRVSLLVALSLPLGYGVQDYLRRRHKNYVSLIGLVNISLTGGLALLKLNGIWFAVKEATLPMVLGFAVLGSAWTTKTAAQLFFCNSQVLNMKLVEERILTLSKADQFRLLLKKTTIWLSLSFFISSAMNFTLAYHIFTNIDPHLTAAQQLQTLNSQIARMTWMGFAMVAFPLMFFSGGLIYYFLKKLAEITGQEIGSILKNV